jgi:hypothetical protein
VLFTPRVIEVSQVRETEADSFSEVRAEDSFSPCPAISTSTQGGGKREGKRKQVCAPCPQRKAGCYSVPVWLGRHTGHLVSKESGQWYPWHPFHFSRSLRTGEQAYNVLDSGRSHILWGDNPVPWSSCNKCISMFLEWPVALLGRKPPEWLPSNCWSRVHVRCWGPQGT